MQFTALHIVAKVLELTMGTKAWSEEVEVASVKRIGLGVMPLPNWTFERGKCGYDLIQYMISGLHVVAYPVGVNHFIIKHWVNGFLAITLEKCEQALRSLSPGPILLLRMGEKYLPRLEMVNCLKIAMPRLVGWLNEAANFAKG